MTIREAARRLGHRSLRPGQEEAVRAVLDGRDVLAVMPTGSGKSLIYRIAAQLIDGPTVVVSPLIALQQDQLEALDERDEGAVTVNSLLSEGRREEHRRAAGATTVSGASSRHYPMNAPSRSAPASGTASGARARCIAATATR